MLALASPIINGSALWKIILASFVGGAGVAVAFGLAIYGVSQARGGDGEAAAPANYAITALAGAFCVLAVVAGIYAMTHK